MEGCHEGDCGIPDNTRMHLLIPFASSSSEYARRTLRELELPHLKRLLARLELAFEPLPTRRTAPARGGRIDWRAAMSAMARHGGELGNPPRRAPRTRPPPVVLLADVRSVGVQGDGRTYGHPIVLRPVSSEDAMTADWTRVPYDVLERISTRITNEVPEVNRVVLDVTSKPPGTIEWE